MLRAVLDCDDGDQVRCPLDERVRKLVRSQACGLILLAPAKEPHNYVFPGNCTCVLKVIKAHKMNIQAIRLTRKEGCVVVDVETQNGWIEVIREQSDGTTPISHTCSHSGLIRANREAANEASMRDLRDSGGIVDTP